MLGNAHLLRHVALRATCLMVLCGHSLAVLWEWEYPTWGLPQWGHPWGQSMLRGDTAIPAVGHMVRHAW